MKFKGRVVSLRKHLDQLQHHNITVPYDTKDFVHIVLKQKQSKPQSCNGRCFMDERGSAKSCYCDTDCKTWGDCCLDFYLR